ncbi:YmfL family putative regulatory protein [Pseudomonas fluorescens]|uniref:Prophage PssSM-01 n=1 Tax=Pseudomonas fluorescens TaxID=294 RepID=A0A0F4T4G9_PSEFL|nr:YmfL family putative regulatory protein [Pseudomonas fluorescens]KJZ38969.1 prophage PssSM-01 [Pseudomonas fluorescens]
MKSPVLETRRAAVIAAANAVSGGLPCAAAFLGEKNFKRFKNRIYESAGVKPLTDDEVCVLETESKTSFLPDYLCAMYGGVFVRLPEAGQLDNVDLYQRALAASSQRGELDHMVAMALEDGEIDAAEAKKIRALHTKYLSASLEAVAAVIELHKART